MRTGGGPKVDKLVENPSIDQFVNIACEIPGAIDSDTIGSDHRNIICATTSDGQLEVKNVEFSDDDLSGKTILLLKMNLFTNYKTILFYRFCYL